MSGGIGEPDREMQFVEEYGLFVGGRNRIFLVFRGLIERFQEDENLQASGPGYLAVVVNSLAHSLE